MSAVTTEEAKPAPLPRMTEAEYLAFEEASPGKHEFRDGEVVAMAGGTSAHSMVEGNLVTALGNRLRGGPCRRFTSNMRILWKNRGQYFYPDASVVCGDPQFAEHEQMELTLLNPRALFEVLSDSTEGYDRGDKCDFCREMPSLELYVLIDPRKPKVTFLRRGDEGLWIIDFLEGSDATLPLPAIGIDIPFAELYENVAFKPADPRSPRTVDEKG